MFSAEKPRWAVATGGEGAAHQPDKEQSPRTPRPPRCRAAASLGLGRRGEWLRPFARMPPRLAVRADHGLVWYSALWENRDDQSRWGVAGVVLDFGPWGAG